MSYFSGGGSTPAIASFVMDTSDYFAATNVEDALSELYALFGTVTGGLDWQASVLDKDRTDPVGGETGGERYIVAAAGAGGLWTGKENQLCEFDGNTSTWDFMVPDEGTACWVDDEDTTYVFTGIHGAGGSWVKLGTTIDHENLTNKIHDGDTLQLDGINSDGGAFAFTTSGAVTFKQNVVVETKATGQATYIANSQTDADARFFFQENDGNKGYLQYDATNNRITLGNSSSGEIFYLKDAGEAQITCDLTGVGLNLTSELDMTGAAAFIDLNPASTGSKNIIDITPSAGLVAGSDWYGIKMTLDALDPATGASSTIMGIRVDASDVTSVDNDATLYGYYYNAPPTEGSYGFYHRLKEMTENKNQRGFMCYANEVLSATASYFGFKVSWSGVTRDANAPVLKGLDIQLPADYTGFGTSYAGFFQGDGRSVLVCDTTYALDVSGAMRLDGVITGVNSIIFDLGTTINEFSVDDTLGGDSDDAVPTEQAVKAYVDGLVVGGHLHDGDTLEHDGVNSDGGAFSFSTTGAITYNQQQIYTHAVAGMLDLNPGNTGSQKVIDLTPSANLAAASTWFGMYMNLQPLDPATGVSSDIFGFYIDAEVFRSVDHDALVYGYLFKSPDQDDSYGFYHLTNELDVAKTQIGFYSVAFDAMSTTATYRAFHADWGAVTRNANAPVLEGIRIMLPANYANFGTSFAGYFSGDGRNVTICDTTYALDVSGAMQLDGVITAINSITLDLGSTINEFSIDDTLAGDSDSALPTEQAVKAYVDGAVGVGGHFHDGDTLQHDGVNSDGGAFSFSTTGAITFNQQQIHTHATAGVLDLNPSNTGTQNVIDITPSAGLAVGTTWRGVYIDMSALDPADGAACTVTGFEVNGVGMDSVLHNSLQYAFYYAANDGEDTAGFYSTTPEMNLGKTFTAFKTEGTYAASRTSTHRGIHVDWDSITRDGNAPVFEGLRIELPANYLNFGTCFAGYFSGDARSVTICDTTYALDVSGTTRITGNGTITGTFGVGGLLTADGVVPEGDLADGLGTAALTWLDLFVQNIKDDDGTTCAHTNSDGDFYINNDLHIGGNDIKDSGGNVVISFDGAGNVDIVATITYATLHVTDLELEGDDIKDSGSNVVISFDGAGKIDAIANINAVVTLESTLGFTLGTTINEISIDDTLAGDSDDAVPTEQAVKAYVDGAVGVGGHFHDGDTLQHDAVNSDGGAFSFSTTGAITFNQQQIYTHAVACMMDLNPSNTGSQKVIDITPSAGIAAASVWYGVYQDLSDLDPATGVGAHVYANFVDMTTMVSVDRDVSAYGYYFAPCNDDDSVGFYSQVPELSAGKTLTAFKTYHVQTLSFTSTYQGIHIDWDQLTRDANAPVVEGIRVELAADLSNFGASFAGYFTADGRSLTICDTTYALDVSGTTRITGNGTITGTFGVGGLLTADGIVPEGDQVDDLGTAALTWSNLYVRDILDAAGNQIIGTDGAGKIDALANISAAVTMESTLAVQGITTTDGLLPEGDLIDDLGSAALTWANLYIRYIKDDDGTTCAHTNSDGHFYIDNDLYVGGDDILDSGPNVIFSFDGAGNVDNTPDFTGGFYTGIIEIDDDNANVVLANMDVTAATGNGIEASYIFAIDSIPIIEVYCEGDGAGGTNLERLHALKDIWPIDNNARTLGDVTKKWSDVWTVLNHVGDLIFDNDFRFTEKPNSLVLLNQNGEPIMEIDTNGNLKVTGSIEEFVEITM